MSISHIAIYYNFCMKLMLRLKEIRVEKGINQQVVAEFLSVRQNTYSQYESGQRQIPLEALIKLAEFYDVSVDYILNLTDDDAPYSRKKIKFDP